MTGRELIRKRSRWHLGIYLPGLSILMVTILVSKWTNTDWWKLGLIPLPFVLASGFFLQFYVYRCPWCRRTLLFRMQYNLWPGLPVVDSL